MLSRPRCRKRAGYLIYYLYTYRIGMRLSSGRAPLAQSIRHVRMLCLRAGESMNTQGIRRCIDNETTRWCNALQQAEVSFLVTMFSPNAEILTSCGTVIRKKKGIEEWLRKTLLSRGPLDMHIETVGFWHMGTLACQHNRYTFTVQLRGRRAASGSGESIVIWEEQRDGCWKIRWDIDLTQPSSVQPSRKSTIGESPNSWSSHDKSAF